MHPSKSKCWYPFEYLSIMKIVHRNDLSDIVYPHGEECEGEARSLVYTVKLHFPDAGYPDRLRPSGKFVKNSTKLTCPEITIYGIKYSTLLWLLERQIRRGRKV